MFWLGANDFAVYAQRSNPAVDALLQRLRPSLAILGETRRPTGAAALVDGAKGLYVAHGDAVQGDTIQARVNDWRVSLRVVGADQRTGLVVLALRSAVPAGLGPALSVADYVPAPGSQVCLVFADGGLPGTFIGGQQFSLTKEKTAMPVSELRFENPQQLVGGALVVSYEGKLLGAMGSTLARPGNMAAVPLRALDNVRRELNAKGAFSGFAQGPNFNPGSLTVAYTPTLTLVRRSVGGLISDGHKPEYAALGVQVGDVVGGGAIIRRVGEGTPAARAGLKVNDILLAIGDQPIRSQYDFVQALLAFKPGDEPFVRVRRDGTERQIEVSLARSK